MKIEHNVNEKYDIYNAKREKEEKKNADKIIIRTIAIRIIFKLKLSSKLPLNFPKNKMFLFKTSREFNEK